MAIRAMNRIGATIKLFSRPALVCSALTIGSVAGTNCMVSDRLFKSQGTGGSGGTIIAGGNGGFAGTGGIGGNNPGGGGSGAIGGGGTGGSGGVAGSGGDIGGGGTGGGTTEIINIGLGQTYDWGTYFPTQQHIQYGNISAVGQKDGVAFPAFTSPKTTEENWDSLSTWFVSSNGVASLSEINPASVLHQVADPAADSYAQVLGSSWANGGVASDVWTLATLASIGVPSTSTAAGEDGHFIRINDGAKYNLVNIRSDGTNFDIFNSAGSKEIDSSVLFNSNYHVFALFRNSTDSIEISIDGTEIGLITNNPETISTGRVDIHARGDGAVGPEWRQDWLRYWNIYNAYELSGTIESTQLDTLDDAREWEVITWNGVSDNGTSISVDYKTGATPTELSAATYSSATSGLLIPESSQKRYLKVRFTLNGTGRYVPVLNWLTVQNNVVD